MQLVPPPNGGEASAYQSATGELVTSEKLTDPAFNLRVGIFGLATDEMRATQMGYPGWHRAGETYFTGGPNNDSAGDGNKTGATYRQGLVDYWRSTFGDWTANYLQKDSWYQRDPSGITMWAGNVDDPTQDSGNQETNQVNKETNYAYTHSQPGGTPVIDVGGIVSGAASALSSVDKVGALYDVLSDTDTWLRVGIVVVGIVGVSVGLFAVTK
jgi:hypothetical protein